MGVFMALITAVGIMICISAIPASHDEKLIGLQIKSDGKQIMVAPGACRIDGKTVTVMTSAAFEVDLPEPERHLDEEYVLSSEKPSGWMNGTHLTGCFAPHASTVLPGT